MNRRLKSVQETTKMGYIEYILGLYWDKGKENGNYRNYRVYIGYILGL